MEMSKRPGVMDDTILSAPVTETLTITASLRCTVYPLPEYFTCNIEVTYEARPRESERGRVPGAVPAHPRFTTDHRRSPSAAEVRITTMILLSHHAPADQRYLDRDRG